MKMDHTLDLWVLALAASVPAAIAAYVAGFLLYRTEGNVRVRLIRTAAILAVALAYAGCINAFAAHNPVVYTVIFSFTQSGFWFGRSRRIAERTE